MDTDARTAPAGLGALAGVAAVMLGAGLGELTALAITPSSSPVASIGGALIAAAPGWAKDAAISLFGTNDKAALLTGIAIVLCAVACTAGWLELRRPPGGRILALALGAIGVAAAVTRAQASILWALPSVVAGVAAAVALGALARRARGATGTDDATGTDAASGADRRTFLVWSGVATVAGALALVGGGLVRAGNQAASAVRSAIRLPQPVAPVTVSAAAELGLPGLAAYVTPNDRFYRIDTALVVPQIDPSEWRLRIHGLVAQEVTLTWDELLALPLEESVTTLACVSNEVGGDRRSVREDVSTAPTEAAMSSTFRSSVLAIAALATLALSGAVAPAAAQGYDYPPPPRWDRPPPPPPHRWGPPPRRCWTEERRVRVETPWGPRWRIRDVRVCRPRWH